MPSQLQLAKIAEPEAAAREMLLTAAERFSLSARGYHRVLKVARTIADLEASDAIHRVHVAEALSYRRRLPEEADTARSGALAQ